MLDYVLKLTDDYLRCFDKKQRKRIGQFFTDKDMAVFMANMFNYDVNKMDLRILDPGAGSGILSAALVDYLSCFEVNSIHIVMYENDENILPLLESICEYMINNSNFDLSIDLRKTNFILDNDFESTGLINRFDMVISNPPYKRISKMDSESQKMLDIVYGFPNLYFLFMAMSLHLLVDGGEMVFIVPRSWTSGSYFRKFRQYLLDNGEITDIHLFISRDNLFRVDSVLQETMILKVSKTENRHEFINVSSSQDCDFSNLTIFSLGYDLAISSDDNSFIYLPTSEEELEVLNKVNSFENLLSDLGLIVRTGLTVGFRNKDLISSIETDDTVPLFYSIHFGDVFINFPIKTDKKQYISKSKKSLLQENRNYLFLKRFTTKEERRRLQPAIYLCNHFPEYDSISTDNKINFVDTIDSSDSLSVNELYGLYVLFNSTLYDVYYRVLDGSTQVNATEINSMHVPDRGVLKGLGDNLLKSNDLSTSNCDKLLMGLD